MTRRPILLGESNPRSDRLGDALSPRFPGSSGCRLWSLTTVSQADFLAVFDRRNLCCRTWDQATAAEAVKVLKGHLREDDVVVLLGRRVQRAMGDPPPGVTFWSVPHPSGRCRAYNDPLVRQRVGRLLTKLAKDSLRSATPRSAAPRFAAPRLAAPRSALHLNASQRNVT